MEYKLKLLQLIFVSAIVSSFAVQADDDFVLVDSDDIRMNNAFKKAKATLSSFLKIVDKGRDKNFVYSAYVQIKDNGETEYLWVTDILKYDKEYYIGYVVSKPRLVSSVKEGETIGYKVDEIFDWQRYDKNKNITYGGYTTCVLLDMKSKEDMDYAKEIGLQCK